VGQASSLEEAKGVDSKTPKALRGGVIPLPSRLGGLVERHKLPSIVRGKALAEIEFCKM